MKNFDIKYLPVVLALSVAALQSACTSVIYATDQGPQRKLDKLTLPGNFVSAIPNGIGSQPDVSFDGEKLAFVRQDSNNVWQVFVMTIGEPATLQQITGDAAPKSYPRWSTQGYLAFAAGSQITVLDQSFTNVPLGATPPQTDGGLDFYDNGAKLVYEWNDNLYSFSISGSGSVVPITSCSTPTTRCNFPVVSHDQTMLAYHVTIMLGPGWAETITIRNASDLSEVSAIVMGPALGGGGKIHSFDFSPTDDRMFVSAKAFDAATSTYETDLELFVVDLDGANKNRLSPAPQVWYPSSYRSFP